MSATPETDAAVIASGGDWSFVLRETCRRLERERDEAREKIKRQASRICELEGATNHAGGIKKDLQENLVFGTPETDAMVERWQNSHIPADFSRRMETERNEARRLADTRLTQLLAITSSEPKDYLGLVVACRVHKDHIAQLIKERDEGREALENHTTATIHTCHSECKRPMCVLRRERDQARELCLKLNDFVAYGLGQSGEPWSLNAMRQATAAIQKVKQMGTLPTD